MTSQIKHLSGEDVPKAWRPTWVVCWVVELNGTIVGSAHLVRPPRNNEAQAFAGRRQARLAQFAVHGNQGADVEVALEFLAAIFLHEFVSSH